MPELSRRALTLIAVVVLTGTASAQRPSPDPRVRLREGIKRDALDAEGRRTYDFVVNATSPHRDGLPAPIGMWMHSPRMAQHILPTYMYLRFGTQLNLRTKELAILITARHVNSRTQWGTHGRNARMIGVDQQVIDVIGDGSPLAGLAETDALVIRFGRELLGDRQVSAETFVRALKLFGRRGVSDLAGLMAFYEFLYLSSNVTFDLEAGGTYPPLPALAGRKPSPRPSRAALPTDINPDSRARLPAVNRDDLDAEGKKTYDAIVNPKTPYSRGLPSPIGMWMHSPEMAQHVLPAYMYLRFGNPFGVRTTELAILATARQINSQYQWTSHEPTALKAGLEANIIDVVKHRKSLEGLGEKDALVIRFSRELLGDRKITAETFARALNAFGAVGVTDLAGLMAFYDFLFLSSNATFDIQMPQGQAPLLPLP